MEELEPAAPFADRLRAYLEDLWAEPVRIERLRRVSQGESRYTWLLDAVPGDEPIRPLVLSIDRDAGLIASHREVEAELLRIVHADGSVPVPELIAAEYTGDALGQPFLLTEWVEGEADPVALLSPDYDDRRPAFARELIEVLGAITAIDPRRSGLAEILPQPTAAAAAAAALDHWEGVLAEHDVCSLPATAAALRHLRRNLPPPAERVCLVHGDYRIGNFLHDGTRITTVLDWELAHLGDPHEDLGWFLSENWWGQRFPGKACGLLDESELIERWEAATGLRCDRPTLEWWRLLAEVKANILWITGASHFVHGRTRDLNIAFIAWMMIPKGEVLIGELLGVTGR